MATVTLPNGQTLEVPDNFDAAAVSAAVKRVMSHPEYQAPPPEPWVRHPTPVPAPPGDSALTRYPKEFGKGLAAGAASLVDTPVNLARLGTRIYDHATGQPVTDPFPRYGAGFQGVVENMLPAPVAGYEGTRTAGELAGAVATPGGAGIFNRISKVGGALPKITQAGREAGKVAGISAGTYAGANVGGAVGQAVGGDVGRDIGELVGGAAATSAPGAIKAAGREFARSQWYREGGSMDPARRRLDIVEAAGVTPSAGLVGNKLAATMEDASANLPFFGRRAIAMRAQQYSDLDQGLLNVADGVRGGPGPAGRANYTPEAIGRDLQDYATNGLDASAETGIQARQEGIENLVGPTTPVPVLNTRRTVATMARTPQLASKREAVRAVGRELRPAINQQGNIRYGELKDARSGLRVRREGVSPLNQQQYTPVYNAMTADMREAALQAGMSPQVFDALQNQTASLYGVRENVGRFSTEADRPFTSGQAFQEVFSATGERNPERLGALEPTNPNLNNPAALYDAFNRVVGNVLEMKGRGAGAGEAVSPTAMNTKALSNWWRNLGPEMRALYTKRDPKLEAQMDALAEVALLDTARPTRTIPGAGGNTMGATWSQYGMPIAAIAGAKATPGFAAKTALTQMGLDAVTGAFTNPETVRRIVRTEDTLGSTAKQAGIDAARNTPAIVEPEIKKRRKQLTGRVSFMPGAR